LTDTSAPTAPAEVFAQALGDEFGAMPPQLQDLHTVRGITVWTGRASVTRGSRLVSKIVALVFGFPTASPDVPVHLTMQPVDGVEHWQRTFAGNKFRSRLSRNASQPHGHIYEQFGLFKFEIALAWKDDRLSYPVEAGRCLGIPFPKPLLPHSHSFEYVDDQGRACFDVTLSVPLGGLVVRYEGWLVAENAH